MVFPDNVVRTVWSESGGRCQCTRSSHSHGTRCTQILLWEKRGKEELGGWEAHHVDSNGPNIPSNCEILCQDCHKATGSYGRS